MEVAPSVAAGIKKMGPAALFEVRGIQRSYRREIERHWRRAFDLYELTLRCCMEAGERFTEDRLAEGSSRVAPVVGPVVTRIQGRACRVTAEVLHLMRGGFAQGALARWRALHELSVVVLFVIKHGDEAARRYVAHEAVERYRAMLDYQRSQPRLRGYESLEPSSVAAVTAAYQEVVDRYGPPFAAPYGWAAHFLSTSRLTKGKGGLAALEADVELDHLRAHYRDASHPVHPGPAGSMLSPDLMPEVGDAVLTGPSPRGMADPGHASLISLSQITISVLSLSPTPSSLVSMQVILQLVDEAGSAFLAAHSALESSPAGTFGSRWNRPPARIGATVRALTARLVHARRTL